MSNYDATTNLDFIDQGDGADTVTVTTQSQLNAGDTFIGGAGVDTIIVGALGGVTLDFTAVGLSGGFYDYEGVTFGNSSGTSNAFFAANQFGAGYISNALHVTGVNGSIQKVFVEGAHNVSAAHWKFTNWEATDFVFINGIQANDVLIGSRGSDVISGNSGADIIRGGPGQDTLIGNGDNDTFQFVRTTDSRKGHQDSIQGFSHIEGDRIDLHKIDANTKIGGNQAFHFIGAQHFHHKAGELHFVPIQNGVSVEGDVNGDGKADFQINEFGLASLVKGDLIL